MAGIQGTGGLANEAFRAALRAQQEASRSMPLTPPGGVSGAAAPTSFVDSLQEGLREVNDQVQKSESLPKELLTGKVDEFHEVAVQLKQSDLSFRFALQVRNKLIDAYREVMRMSV